MGSSKTVLHNDICILGPHVCICVQLAVSLTFLCTHICHRSMWGYQMNDTHWYALSTWFFFWKNDCNYCDHIRKRTVHCDWGYVFTVYFWTGIFMYTDNIWTCLNALHTSAFPTKKCSKKLLHSSPLDNNNEHLVCDISMQTMSWNTICKLGTCSHRHWYLLLCDRV